MVKISAVIDENNYKLTYAAHLDKLMKRFNSKFEHFCREYFGRYGGHYDAVFERSLLIG